MLFRSGTALAGQLRDEGNIVLRFVRRSAKSGDEIQWDPKSGQVDLGKLDGVNAVIHLAGAGVGDRWVVGRAKGEDHRVLRLPGGVPPRRMKGAGVEEQSVSRLQGDGNLRLHEWLILRQIGTQKQHLVELRGGELLSMRAGDDPQAAVLGSLGS